MGNICDRCCRKSDKQQQLNDQEIFLPAPMTVTSTTGDSSISIYNERWRVKRLLGAGGCGFVYEVEDLRSSNGSSYAMKTEVVKRPNHPGRLPQEVLVIRSLEKKRRSRHLVEILDKGRVTEAGSQPLQYIVMTLLGPSLSDLTVFCKRNVFVPTTVALVAIQTLEAIEDLHVTGWIHRDIKPSNFMIGLPPDVRNIYLIDFGMARKYIDNKGKLMKVRPGKVRFRGTYRYCASDSHKGIEYGRHHDLICWFYGLVEMRMGYLPWYQWETDKRELYKIKKGISPYKWLRQIEPEYLNLYERLTSLFYDMTPQYGLYRQIFINLLAKDKVNTKSPFQWELNSPDAADFDHLRYRSVYKQVKHGLCHTVSERAALLKTSPTATIISAKKSPDVDSSISVTETEGSASRRADKSRIVQDIQNVDGLKSGEDYLAEAIRKATVRQSPKTVDKNEVTTREIKKRDSILSSSINIFNKVMKRKPKKKEDNTKKPGFITQLATNPTVLAGAVVKKSNKPRVASGTFRNRTMKVAASTTRKTSPKISIQRPLSAANDLALLKRKMAEMIKENRLLRQIQHRQEICMRRMEESKADAPAQVIRCQEEIRVLKEHLRIQRLKNLEFDRLLRDRGMQMEQLRDRLRRTQQAVDDQGLRMPRRSKENKIMQKMLIEKEKTIKKLLSEVELLKSKRFNAEILNNIAQIEAENEKVEKSVTKEIGNENFQEKGEKSQRKKWEKEIMRAKADKGEENRFVLTTPKDSTSMKRSPSQKKDDQQQNQQSNKYSMPLSYSNQNLSQHQSRVISLQHHRPPGAQDQSTVPQTPVRSTSIAANLIGRNFANHSTINSAASSHLTFKK